MDEEATRELLEATHDFPCPYAFKVIGTPDNGFIGRIIAAVRLELADDADPPYTMRQTRSGRHVALTLNPTVTSADQILAVYDCLRSQAGVVMIL